jgi:hypothetical protein
MTTPTPDRWAALRARPLADPDLEPRDRAEVWQLLTTYDRSGGTDELTGKPLALDDAVVVVAGSQSEAHVLHRDTWAQRRQEAIETLTGLPVLSTIDAPELADRIAALTPPVASQP